MTKDKAERRITIRLYPADLETLNELKEFFEWLGGNKATYTMVIRKALYTYIYDVSKMSSWKVFKQFKQRQQQDKKVKEGEEEA